MDENAGGAAIWGAVGLAVGAVAKSVSDIVTGRRKATLDQLQMAMARLDKVEDRCDTQRSALDALEHQRGDLMDKLASEKAARKVAFDDLCEKLEEQTEHLSATSAALSAAQEQLVELRGEIELLRAERDDLAEVVAALTAQVETGGHTPSRTPRPRNGKGQFSK